MPSLVTLTFAPVIPSEPAMPRTPRPWVVPQDDKLSPAGRPRGGPKGKAVRELPRVTIRAQQAAIDAWLALVAADERPAWEVFADMVRHYRKREPR